MGYLSKDTICAIATASGTAAISVIRMSGDKSHEIALSRYIKKGKELTLENIIPNRMYIRNPYRQWITISRGWRIHHESFCQ